LNEVKPIVLLRQSPQGDGFRGAQPILQIKQLRDGGWTARYWEHTLRDARHADYIHFNPVKHGHVSGLRDWPYSSFHRMVRFDVYPLDWAGDAADNRSLFGER
jgi:hypothetical protein